MRRGLAPRLALLLLAGCFRVIDDAEELLQGEPRAGRDRIARELEPPQLVRKSSPMLGVLTTGLSSASFLFGLDRDQAASEHLIRFQLPDGTLVGGCCFPGRRVARGQSPC